MQKPQIPKWLATAIAILIITGTAYMCNATTLMQKTRESTLIENPKGRIIVFYKDGCPDCEATMEQIETAMQNADDVIFLNTQSNTGKKIRERYPIHEVPSAIYIHKNDENYTSYVLYKKTESGIETDFAAITRIIELQKNSR